MTSPRQHHMQILGLGNSVGTPAVCDAHYFLLTSQSGITAAPIVVTSWDDLAAKAALIPGKIVVYNVPFTTYGATVQYRVYIIVTSSNTPEQWR